MEVAIIIVFIVGYLFIAFEHSVNVNKTASALLTGVLCWTLFILSDPTPELLSSTHFKDAISHSGSEVLSSTDEVFHEYVLAQLSHHLADIAEIVFFLLGAMTIVELLDAHHAFSIITDRINTRKPIKLLWIICWVTFFLSAVLDNLTTAIVMVSLIRKLIPERSMRMFFAGMIVIAANAGGAWSPVGDVTTTMLWINGQISAANIMKVLLIPSIACLLVPLVFISFRMKGGAIPQQTHSSIKSFISKRNSQLMLAVGIGALISVPIFKSYTHLPPYVGVLLGLSVLWIISEMIHPGLDEHERKKFTAAAALSRIDASSVLFFLGILLAVGALESMLLLQRFAEFLSATIGDNRMIITMIGLLSSVVDNVPLVAASMGMYSMEVYPQDHLIWEYLAYCAGTGGSVLIIGSAAGVAVMGIEKIDFFWYVKRISFIALIGYAAGAIMYLLLHPFFL